MKNALAYVLLALAYVLLAVGFLLTLLGADAGNTLSGWIAVLGIVLFVAGSTLLGFFCSTRTTGGQ